ncbi:MAG: DUF3311 domain-containing protein [Gemmatimonadaceae bacterium]|jgi:hypothetical protein
MPADTPVREPSRWRRYHLLALLPAVGMLGGLPFANRVYPLVFGLPFLMAWLVGWVVATAGIMAWILRLDRLNGIATDEVQGHGHGEVQRKGGVRGEGDEDVR